MTPRALVTGATSGIGASITTELAARGHDLVLVARDAERLSAVAASLPGAPEIIAADLTDPNALADVEGRCASAASPIDVLVNNAGFGTYGPFHAADLDGETRMVALNVLAPVRLAHAAAGAMAARGVGAILNVASLASYQPLPENATYAATKAFLRSFGQALHEELRPFGVTVTTVCPGYTHTEFHARAGVAAARVPDALWTDADEVAARAGLDALARGRALCIPGAFSKVTAALSMASPDVITRKLGRRLNNQLR